MLKSKIKTIIVNKGKKPFCLKTGQQCRGCFGWRNMLQAAQTDKTWQEYPFKCLLTGLTLQVQKINKQ